MKKEIFNGACTALITPFSENGIDYEAFGNLIEFQISSGISALLFLGTTGEAQTLTKAEYKEVLHFAAEKVKKRVPIICGVGSNSTANAVENIKIASEFGYDAMLVVLPFYNKPTQIGLISHFAECADASESPIIIYNVPSRTGTNIDVETLQILSQHDNISGFKDAEGNLSKSLKIINSCRKDFSVYSGNDDLILPMLSIGAKGVISVASNAVPAEINSICRLYFSGKIEDAQNLHYKYLKFMNLLFSETNPIPIKTAMSKMGYCNEIFRLPMCRMSESKKAELLKEMAELKLIETEK